jgi:hypothetical protein
MWLKSAFLTALLDPGRLCTPIHRGRCPLPTARQRDGPHRSCNLVREFFAIEGAGLGCCSSAVAICHGPVAVRISGYNLHPPYIYYLWPGRAPAQLPSICIWHNPPAPRPARHLSDLHTPLYFSSTYCCLSSPPLTGLFRLCLSWPVIWSP